MREARPNGEREKEEELKFAILFQISRSVRERETSSSARR